MYPHTSGTHQFIGLADICRSCSAGPEIVLSIGINADVAFVITIDSIFQTASCSIGVHDIDIARSGIVAVAVGKFINKEGGRATSISAIVVFVT